MHLQMRGMGTCARVFMWGFPHVRPECVIWLGDHRSVDISLALLVRALFSLWWLHLRPLGPAPFL